MLHKCLGRPPPTNAPTRRAGTTPTEIPNVFDLGDKGLLIRPVKPLAKAEVANLLAQPAAGSHSSAEASAIVSRALRKVRRR